MPAQYIYQHAQGSNVDLSGQVRAYTQEVSMNAEEGSVAISSITVDDQAGGLDIIGHHKFLIRETSEASNSKTILYGLVADRDVKRGPFRQLNSREWTVNLADVNSLLNRPIMRGADSNRPAETDLARIQWLMGTGEMQLILDTTYVSTTAATTPMDAVDYRDQTMLSVIDDCAQASGKNYWVIVMNEDPNPRLGLFYDFAYSTAYTSTVRLTNVLADVDSSTTFAVFNDDLKLNRDPSRVYAEVLLPYDGGEVFVTNASTLVNFGRRDTTAPSVNVKSADKANARALRYLNDISTEEDRLTMSYLVPLAKVNQLMHGHRFQVKFSHLPGYETYTYVRAVKRTVKMESEEFYRVTIEATGLGAVGGTNTCSTDIAATESTGVVADTTTSGPVSIPVSAASFSGAQHICFASYVGPSLGLGGCAPLVIGGSGWTLLEQESDLGSNGWVAVGYNKRTSGAPANMTVTNTCSGGGTATFFSNTFAFPSAGSAPVQHSAISGSGGATLPGTPTPGNILYCWNLSSISAADTSLWVADGGTILVSGVSHNGGQWFLTIGIRCVRAGETTSIRIPAGSHANYGSVSEWAP